MRIRQVAPVFLGGGLGACARMLVAQALQPLNGSLPTAVLLINLAGAWCLGTVYAFADEAEVLRPGTRLFVAVGFLGGFTTFSTFAWDADQLAQQTPIPAAVYVAVSVLGGWLSAIGGLLAGRELVNLPEQAVRVSLFHRRPGRSRRQRRGHMNESDGLEDREETA